MQNKKTKKQDGLPSIAETARPKPVVFVVMVLVAIIVVVVSLFSSKAGQLAKPVKEEIYQVETPTIPVANNAPVSNTQGVTHESLGNREVSQAEISAMVEKQKELQQRLGAPLMIVNNTVSEKSAETSDIKKEKPSNSNTRFMEEVASRESTSSQAVSIGSLNTIIAEGSFLHANLEPATDSDLPGYLRASISEPVYSEDGSRVLVPRGSRLIGEYKSGMMQGQSRVFIVWSRLITPAGVSIQLASSGVDTLGVSGMSADSINRHFWERFGMASLLSILGTSAANVGVSGSDENNSASAYRSAIAGSFAQSAGDSLQQDAAIAPTLKTYQGKSIMVFVAHDLQFANALKEVAPSINVF